MFTRLNNVMVVVSDMERSLRFYRDQLGLKALTESPYWSALDEGGVQLGLHPAGNGLEVNPATGITFAFASSDIDATLAELRTRGIEPVRVSREDFGTLVDLQDPDGYRIQVVQYRP
jgi:catechol 2,3-dioxygenase-like lactoylglutathione lyase family enzyme